MPVDHSSMQHSICDSVQPVKIQGKSSNFRSHHSEYKGNSFVWDGCEVIIKDDTNVVLVLEPHDIDNFLNYRVSIWVTWAPAKIEFLWPIRRCSVGYKSNTMRYTR